MTGIILYQSKYGATKKYVEWLVEETGFDTVETSKARTDDIKKYDVVVLGGGIYAMGIAGISFLRKNRKVLNEKKVIVFCVGASPFDTESLRVIKERNMKDEMKDTPFFYCRGGWDLDSMSVIDRSMCKILRKSVSKKDPGTLEVWEKALMSAGDEKCDWTDRKYLEPVLKEINK